jgi:class 3 adenylate cyclase/Tfp pilus assembly protein PilF
MINQRETGARALSLLRQFGWETGAQKLREEIATMSDARLRDEMRVFAGWITAESGAGELAWALMKEVEDRPLAAKWSQFVQAFLAMRERRCDEAERLLVAIEPEPASILLRAAVGHIRGANFFHRSMLDEALVELREALRLLGKDHYGTGRVLDTFGMVYEARDNFHSAAEFFQQAIARKKSWDDEAGLAVSYGNLGRLNLDWGYFDQAEGCFLEDLKLAQKMRDARSEALVQNQLGRVALERGNRVASAQPDAAREHWADALGWLDSSIRTAGDRASISEAYARKDRALLYLAEGQVDSAEVDARKAEELFAGVNFAGGLAHVNRLWGVILRQRNSFDEAKQKLRAALDSFTQTRQRAEQARTQREIARLSRSAGEPRPLTTRAYASALDLAESCRRADLVREIGEELKMVNPEAYYSRVFRRVRGRGFPDDTDSLISGTTEPLTSLFLDLKGSTSYALANPPEVVMMTLNQMMADMVETLRGHEALVSVFRGDGFMAIFRGHHHARRAVSAGLDLCRQMEEFNEPRTILGLKQFAVRIGISTGDAVLGNVGTYDLMDFTAIGTTVNLGARLESEAEPGFPCISRRTYDEVRGHFLFREGNPRTIVPKGMEELGGQPVWDVTGRAPSVSES